MENVLKNFVIIFVGLIVISPILQAQENDEFVFTKQIGLTLSSVTGAGIQYIYPSTEKDNIKVVGIFIYNNDTDNKDSFFSLGLEYQRDLRESNIQRVYAFGGAHIDNSFSEETFFNSDGQQDSFFSLGGGMGVDLGDRKRGLILNFHAAYQFTRGFGDEDKTRIGLGAGIGIGFNF
tara:strand:+ start:15682 stop:16212 length:531 start_codon:yes stop_codon:yes gene_type:complete